MHKITIASISTSLRPVFKRYATAAMLATLAMTLAQPASAADTLKFTGFEFGYANVSVATHAPLAPSVVSTASAGAFKTSLNNGPTFESFCVDIWQYLSFNTNYSVPATYTQMPSMVGYTPHAGAPVISSAVTGNLSRLYDEATTLGYGTGTKSAALQLAIWEIAYETPGNYDLNAGNFYSSTNTAAKTQAATWLAGLGGYSATKYSVSGFVSATKQDVIYFTETPITHQVPEPETYALMLMGLGLLGLAARRKKSRRPE